jgi:hypothetical protein
VSQKHLTFLKSENQHARYVPVVMYSDVWSLVEMEHWPLQHRIAAVELYIKTGLLTSTQRGYCQQFQGRDAL